MKYLPFLCALPWAILVGVVLLVLTGPVCAQSGCGFKPFPPMGCKSSDAVCRCDDNGCQWVWYCN
jgi:hypothetical protein